MGLPKVGMCSGTEVGWPVNAATALSCHDCRFAPLSGLPSFLTVLPLTSISGAFGS